MAAHAETTPSHVHYLDTNTQYEILQCRQQIERHDHLGYVNSIIIYL